MLNKVTLIGRLGADPDVRSLPSGDPVVSLRIATDENYTDRDGNRAERTEWHRVSVFRRQAENCGRYLRKGSLVYIEGKLTTRKWTDQNGQDRYSTEIRADRVVFLDRKSSDEAGFRQNPQERQNGIAAADSGQTRASASDRQQPPTETWDNAPDGLDSMPF